MSTAQMHLFHGIYYGHARPDAIDYYRIYNGQVYRFIHPPKLIGKTDICMVLQLDDDTEPMASTDAA